MKGAADNWSIGSYIHSSSSDKDFSDGKHYYSIYAVYFDGVEFIRADRQDNLLAAYSLSQNDYDLWISQTSSVYPDEIETNGGEPNTYNWDQYIYISSNTYRHPGAVIRYTLDGSEPDVNSEEYTRPFIIPADGTLYTVKAALFNSDREKISETIQSQYKINYNAYNNNFKIIAKNGSTVLTTDDGNINYHSSQITNFHVEYKPVCGEVFSVYKKAVTGTIAASESLGGPSGYLSAFASVTPTILADNSVINNAVIENAHQTTAVTSWQIDDAVGKDNGGMMSRFAVRLSIAGRPSTVNNNLIDGENLKRADCTVVYPQLSITNLDMFERPLMTPYLWTKQEPVAVMNVKSKDFFTEDESFRNNIRVFFNVQYAAKNFPYGASGDTYGNPSSYNIRWQGTLSDPTGIEEIYSRSGNAIQLIKVDPLPKSLDADMPENWNGKKWYLNENNTYANYLRTITPSDGQLFHQIDNPYDSAKIGEKAHTDNIAAVGTLDEKAFRTVLRFRARAVEDGYRTSTVVKSFESTDASTFDTTTRDTISETGKPTVAGIPRFENGTSSKTSDFPLAYRSYPIEVCEHHEGWTTENRLSINWYEKHGIKYYGAGQGMTGITNAKNERDDSRFKNFNPNNKKLLVYVHGWQPTASYEIPGYEPGSGYMENISNPTDLASWKSIYGDPKVNPSTNYHQREWVADHWHAKGYNFAVFNWNRYSNSSRESTIGGISSGVQVPGPSESKVWFPTGGHGMAFFKENTVKKGAWSSVRDKAYSDSIRSANMGLVLAQDILDSIPEGIEPELFTIAAHSLGNNTAINATYKLYMKVRDNKLTMHRVPDRIDLLDPYYGTLTTGTDSDTNNTPGLTDALFEASYSCRYISGVTDSLYSDVLHHYAHIPIQWYRTSALTQPQTNSENDPNYRFFGRVNFQKMYFATGYWTKSGWNRSLDGGYIKVDEQSYTMAVAGIDTPHLNGDLHSEAHAWFFRSIQRNDSDASVVISASVPPAALWNRLNAYRFTNTDSPNVGYQWFEMQGHPDNDAHTGNQTVSVIDDEFIIRTGVQYGFNWMWSGLQKYASGSPGCMNY